MALADVVERIMSDARAETQAIRDATTAEADALLKDARVRAAAISARVLEEAEREARREAQTIEAAARLAARDESLAAKGELIRRAILELESAVVALSSPEYTAFLARAIVESARGDERVLIAPADREKLAGLEQAVTALASQRGRVLSLSYPGEAASVEHGVVLAGQRDSVDLSIAGVIDGEREKLTIRLAADLFAFGEDA